MAEKRLGEINEHRNYFLNLILYKFCWRYTFVSMDFRQAVHTSIFYSQKLLTSMLPTEEECDAILKAKAEQNGLPLGQAEEFLITLSEITHLKPRLELWLFKLDYETTEKEIADPLTDLKQVSPSAYLFLLVFVQNLMQSCCNISHFVVRLMCTESGDIPCYATQKYSCCVWKMPRYSRLIHRLN